MEFKTVWTTNKSPDAEVNKLLQEGWRVMSVNVVALQHPRYTYLEANFIVTLVKDVQNGIK